MKRLLMLTALCLSAAAPLAMQPAQAQLSINVSVDFAPPALPIYDQPPIPAPDYIWTPGYWAWDDYVEDYYWVPGVWLRAPRPGLLWTPPWWGWQGGAYLFHSGYWGSHVGFYGGVVYGFGYTGLGFEGARWDGRHVSYNRSVTNITNVNVTNVYNKTVIVNRTTNVSYNGGPSGMQARPSAADQAAMREEHVAPSAAQAQHVQAARANRQLFASANRGRPPVAASAKPGQFSGSGIVATRQAAIYRPPAQAAGSRAPGNPRVGAGEPNGEQAQGMAHPLPTDVRNVSSGQKPAPSHTGFPRTDGVPLVTERSERPASDKAGERPGDAAREPDDVTSRRENADAARMDERQARLPMQARPTSQPHPPAPKTPPPRPRANPSPPRPHPQARPKPAPRPAPHRDEHR